ncbi:hypothetical protein VFPFJ_00287 [Purpureocillium lilacinum]|uniref:Uncharacterized protein n=1 Tax=Purpureocillium lilacinum TaxID=33203 RepID=A0A179HXG3_PURLI|nr:hypothetical protein VFPFJ_00287 [Purpureocillium lilacinum]OAQ94178.1 hypothetical protein VFPFJ_00287 [Purpureocillium lilacinum]
MVVDEPCCRLPVDAAVSVSTAHPGLERWLAARFRATLQGSVDVWAGRSVPGSLPSAQWQETAGIRGTRYYESSSATPSYEGSTASSSMSNRACLDGRFQVDGTGSQRTQCLGRQAVEGPGPCPAPLALLHKPPWERSGRRRRRYRPLSWRNCRHRGRVSPGLWRRWASHGRPLAAHGDPLVLRAKLALLGRVFPAAALEHPPQHLATAPPQQDPMAHPTPGTVLRYHPRTSSYSAAHRPTASSTREPDRHHLARHAPTNTGPLH